MTQCTGGCSCGAIRYASSVPPVDVHFCHCRMCQKALGNVFGVFGSVPLSAFRFTAGTPKLYRSSSYAERGFCADCGTPLTFRYLKSDWIAVAIGTLDEPDKVRPEMHWGVESQLPWLHVNEDLPRRQIEGDPGYMAWRDVN